MKSFSVFIKSRFIEIRKNRILFSTVCFSYVFLVLHAVGYFESNGRTEVIVRFVAVALYPLFVLAGKGNGARLWGILYALLLFWFRGSLYYAPFIFMAGLCYGLKKEVSASVLAAYAVILAMRATLYDVAPFRVVFHCLKCLVIYNLLLIAFKEYSRQHKPFLILQPDEIQLLELLAGGMRQSEVTGYSQNSISRKLKSARLRNGIETNKDLILIYSNSQNRDDLRRDRELKALEK